MTPPADAVNSRDSREQPTDTSAPATSRRLPAMGTQQPPKHGVGGWRSLIISMAVIAGVVLFVLALAPSPREVQRAPVDVAASAQDVSKQTGWSLLVPDLGSEWKATNVRLGETAGVRTWEFGMVRTDDPSVYVSVAQTGQFAGAAPSQDWVRELTRAGGSSGTVSIHGAPWQSFTAPATNPRHSLVAPVGATPTAVVVSGLGDPDNLAVVASSLHPYTSAAT